MGVIHKLKPKIRDFIIQKKNAEPHLSCRKLTSLIFDKFEVKVSKSSINTLIKDLGMSMPVGRRRKKKRRLVPEAEGLGAIMLKAVDSLAGGSYYMADLIKSRLKSEDPEILPKTECLLYAPLFDDLDRLELKPECGLWPVVNQKFTSKDLLAFLEDLQAHKPISSDIHRVVSTIFQEVRCIKVNYSGESVLYLDGNFYTLWSSPHIPFDFSATVYNIKSYINRYFKKSLPFMLFMAPGYDRPSKDFFDLLSFFQSSSKRTLNLSIHNNKFEEIAVFPLEMNGKHPFIFGLWPWQFSSYRKVKKIGEFRQYALTGVSDDFYIADTEIDLLQPNTRQIVTLRGCAVKKGMNEKTRVIILSNATAEQVKTEDLANIYLSHWPNLEETFQDLSRKIELFTYTATSQKFFSTDNLVLQKDSTQDIKALLNYYISAMDLYVKWHFLPSGYEEKDFSTIKQRFYSLKGIIKNQNDCVLVTFKPPVVYPFLKDLEYACRRINEKEIIFGDGRRLWLNVSAA